MDFSSRGGFVVTIHRADQQPFPMDMGTYIPVGFVTSLKIDLVSALCTYCNPFIFDHICRRTRTCCLLHIAVVSIIQQRLIKLTEFESFLHIRYTPTTFCTHQGWHYFVQFDGYCAWKENFNSEAERLTSFILALIRCLHSTASTRAYT